MDSLRQDSCGKSAVPLGTIIERQDIHGGFQDCIMYSRCMMLSESIISVDLMNTFQFRMGQRMRSEDIGRKDYGIDLFRKVEQALGWKQVIAEDLGYVTDSVRELIRESGFPGNEGSGICI